MYIFAYVFDPFTFKKNETIFNFQFFFSVNIEKSSPVNNSKIRNSFFSKQFNFKFNFSMSTHINN